MVVDDGVGNAVSVGQEDDISCEEVATAMCIGRLKNRKAPGVCGISAEMLKEGGSIVVKWLHSVIQLMWQKGEVMEDWARVITVPLYKKSNKWCVTITKGLVC